MRRLLFEIISLNMLSFYLIYSKIATIKEKKSHKQNFKKFKKVYIYSILHAILSYFKDFPLPL